MAKDIEYCTQLYEDDILSGTIEGTVTIKSYNPNINLILNYTRVNKDLIINGDLKSLTINTDDEIFCIDGNLVLNGKIEELNIKDTIIRGTIKIKENITNIKFENVCFSKKVVLDINISCLCLERCVFERNCIINVLKLEICGVEFQENLICHCLDFKIDKKSGIYNRTTVTGSIYIKLKNQQNIINSIYINDTDISRELNIENDIDNLQIINSEINFITIKSKVKEINIEITECNGYNINDIQNYKTVTYEENNLKIISKITSKIDCLNEIKLKKHIQLIKDYNIDYQINEDVTIESDEENLNLNISNDINGDLIINCNLKNLIIDNQCFINGNLILNGKIQSLKIDFAKIHHNLFVNNCIEDVKINDLYLKQYMIFNSKITNLELKSCYIENNINIHEDVSNLTIVNARFKSNIICHCNNLKIDSDSRIEGCVYIKANRHEDYKNIINSVEINDVRISDITFENDINTLTIDVAFIGFIFINSVLGNVNVLICECNDYRFNKIQKNQIMTYKDERLKIKNE